MKRNITGSILVALCLLVFIGLQVFFSFHENQSIDEGVHITAGYTYLVTGDYRMNPEHPPLAKLIAAAPLLLLDLELPLDHWSWESGDQWVFAQQFLYKAGNDADRIIRVARLPMILLSTLLGMLIAIWSYKIAGWSSSVISTALYSTSPLFLTHGHFVTTDIAVALGIFASTYFFSAFLRHSTWKNLTVLSIVIGATATVKFSGLLVLPLLFLCYLVVKGLKKNQTAKIFFLHMLRDWGAIILVTLLLILITTGFSAKSLSEDPFHGQAQIARLSKEKIEGSAIERLVSSATLDLFSTTSVPGYPYLAGFLEFEEHFNYGHETFFLGEHTDAAGPWYFPIALFLKVRLGFAVLLSLFLTLFVKLGINSFLARKKLYGWFSGLKETLKTVPVEKALLFIVPAVFFATSMTSQINIGVRHIFPVFPFLFIAAGMLWSVRLKMKPIFRYIVYSIFAVTIFSGFSTFPQTMAYFSEVVGPADNGYHYLRDSNLDWGQNLKYLKTYLDEKGYNNQLCYSYFGQGNLEFEGINGGYLPNNQDIFGQQNINCIVVISIESLFFNDAPYSWLWNFTPIDLVAHSFFVFDLRK